MDELWSNVLGVGGNLVGGICLGYYNTRSRMVGCSYFVLCVGLASRLVEAEYVLI